MTEVREDAAAFALPITLDAPGCWRRIAGIGPAYQIIADCGDVVRVRTLDEDIEFDYRRADAELDPLA